MTTTTPRLTILMVTLAMTLALLLSGCGLLRPRTASPRVTKNPETTAELAALREENNLLREQQEEALDRIDALAKNLAEEKAERERFREMMATNFDLLEQSVALSLSKSIGKQPIVQPNELTLPAKKVALTGDATRRPRALPPGAAPAWDVEAHETKSADGQGKKPASRAVKKAIQNARTALTAADAKARISRAMARKAALQGGGNRANTGAADGPLDDPDLMPPSNPYRLTGHREAKALYDKGFGHFARKEYDRAILVYEDFLTRYPKDIYSDNAQFWIGESYLRQNRLDEAEAAYREVLRNYEHRSSLEGYKTPESIYRIGQTYLKRNDGRRAKYYFSAVAEKFANTSAGRKAQRELASLAVKTAGARSGSRLGRGS